MALSRKKSRPITVEGDDYRWRFFENSGWNDVTVQIADGYGPKLVVQFPWEHQGTLDIPLYPPVTPTAVSLVIKQALLLGWEPRSSGQTWQMRWTGKDLLPISPCS